jgi:hypothetical protein
VVVIGLVLVVAFVAAVWLVRHPLVLLTLNVVPVVWLMFGAGGGALVGLVLFSAGLMVRHPRSLLVG